MKKLYRKGSVHPSGDDFPSLSFLPAAILSLSAALSADDKQVLSYLLSCSTTSTIDFDPSKSSSSSHKRHNKTNNNNTHATCFTCYCFSCYTCYWSRWDSSPNRQLIHEIIDAFEDHLLTQRKKKHGVNKRDKNKTVNNKSNVMHNHINGVNPMFDGSVRVDSESGGVESVEKGLLGDETGEKQGSVRKMVSFLWGSIWG